MPVRSILPWQTEPWRRMQECITQGRLPHALLLTGASGLGKTVFAQSLAGALLCERPRASGEPCGACRACYWLDAATHPDLLLLQPEEPDKPIRIDPVRAFCQSLSLTSQCGGHKVGLIAPAHHMNSAAANSLLKTLEEPAADTLIVLISDRPSALLPTIQSRCQRLHLAPPSAQEALPWLQRQLEQGGDAGVLLALAAGAPLKAVALSQTVALEQRSGMLDDWIGVRRGVRDPVALAGAWISLGLAVCVDWMTTWVMDLIRLKVAGLTTAVINEDLREPLQGVAQVVDATSLFKYLDDLTKASRLLQGTVNQQLLLEGLLIDWGETV